MPGPLAPRTLALACPGAPSCVEQVPKYCHGGCMLFVAGARRRANSIEGPSWGCRRVLAMHSDRVSIGRPADCKDQKAMVGTWKHSTIAPPFAGLALPTVGLQQRAGESVIDD
ncbi:predicted protein [Pyrenophora tritici-repentis Pt-1C-BFP]|uniref:Uncharacterized protein n=1 Tax=Pyrenophora tritici-repentis (strain Pt-1C-BFP) TaxID=426418 RepID=B2W4C2_PYRTR|nr:uncharacterized protein PTRG_04472 [Pyrenophora tritici-repentis Pt-1C-BFP]EDU47379.1 predicted protein [Pyrenophora tritici-repentis Pt-1C-BFP]